MPDAPYPYEHEAPHRPSHLSRRTTPPPERPSPPNLRYLIYVGVALLAVLAALAVPYVIGYLVGLIGN